MSNWTPEMDAELRRRWGAGQTASKIASEMHLVSRNAAIGRAARLGLAKRPSPIKRTNSPVQQTLRSRAYRQRKKLVSASERQAKLQNAEPVVNPASSHGDRIDGSPKGKAAFAQDGRPHWPQRRLTSDAHAGLSRGSCAWPIGDPKAADFHFCQAKPVVPGKPYCLEHCQRAYRSPDEPASERAEPPADRQAA